MKISFDPILGKLRREDSVVIDPEFITNNDIILGDGYSSQYIRGDGSKVTFPTLLKTVDLNSTSAFSTSYTNTTNSDGSINRTINLSFTGNSDQYIKGDGTLATFPTSSGGTVTSVQVSVPAAFEVLSSPVTTSGTIAITAAGDPTQYIRGDGELANFPVSLAAGGASVNYFLNGNTNTLFLKDGILCQELNATANTGTEKTFSRNTPGVIAVFLTPTTTPNALLIPSGTWTIQLYAKIATPNTTAGISVKLYKRNTSNVFTQIGLESKTKILNTTEEDIYSLTITIPSNTNLLVTDTLAIEVIAKNNSGNLITIYTEGNTVGQVTTTFSTGLLSLNGSTKQVQSFAIGTGTLGFSTSTLGVHTLNLPSASSAVRGLLTNTDWTIFNSKDKINFTNTGTGAATFSRSGSGALAVANLNIPDNSVGIQNNGVTSLSVVKVINFTGTSHTITLNGTTANIALTGGGGGGVASASNNLFAYYNFI